MHTLTPQHVPEQGSTAAAATIDKAHLSTKDVASPWSRHCHTLSGASTCGRFQLSSLDLQHFIYHVLWTCCANAGHRSSAAG